MRILERIYAIGGGPGANRVGGSRGEQDAHELVAGWLEAAGLSVEVDPNGNLLGRLQGDDPEAAEVWVGSHLDSVPNGGRDAGVLAAAGVRGGMLFVRSGAGGVRHSPDEWSDPEDVALCVDVLAASLERLASAP